MYHFISLIFCSGFGGSVVNVVLIYCLKGVTRGFMFEIPVVSWTLVLWGFIGLSLPGPLHVTRSILSFDFDPPQTGWSYRLLTFPGLILSHFLDPATGWGHGRRCPGYDVSLRTLNLVLTCPTLFISTSYLFRVFFNPLPWSRSCRVFRLVA